MTIEELIKELSTFPGDAEVVVSVMGTESYATQLIWQGSPSPPIVIIDDYPNDYPKLDK